MWEVIFDLFIGILIIFVSVAVYFGLRTESVKKSMYKGITEDFIADVKRNGVLTLDEYESYIGRMGRGNGLFDISFEHRYKLYEPEYRFKTLEEILEDINNAYKGSNDYHYRDVITERPHVDDPINDGNLNIETNESILAKAVNGPADPNHVHDEDCYGGHKHLGEPSFTHTHAHSSECREYITYIEYPYRCNSCHESYVGRIVDYYWDGNTNQSAVNYYDNNYNVLCPHCGSQSRMSQEQINYYGYSCGYDRGGYNGLPEKTPYGVPYEYVVSFPQDVNKATYNNGCYTYHREHTFKSYLEYIPYSDIYTNASVSSVFKALLQSDFQGFCEIPASFTIKVISEEANPTYPSNPNSPDNASPQFSVSYSTIYDNENDVVEFYYRGYEIMSRGLSTDNPGFPEVLTGAELANLYSSKYEFFPFIKAATGRSYDYGYCKVHRGWSRSYIKTCNNDGPTNVWYNDCGFDEDNTLDCNKIIVSLNATHTEQTVYVDDSLITTAIATYKDGSTKTVVCTTDFTTSVIGKNQSVILEYNYIIDGLTYTKSCIIEVTVIPRNKTCIKGHSYNLNDNGSDPGCPYCSEWVESLQVINPTTSPIVITIGTTLQENDVRLLATYMDGHTEEVTSQYIDNLDTGYLGTKPVTIGYKGASVTVLVTTVCATMICDICGYEYNLYPDGTNPGCPRCIQKIPVFTGNVMVYEHINHTEEILDILYKKKKYIFNLDDVFSVSVHNKSSSISRRLLRWIYPSISDKWLHIEKKEHMMSK